MSGADEVEKSRSSPPPSSATKPEEETGRSQKREDDSPKEEGISGGHVTTFLSKGRKGKKQTVLQHWSAYDRGDDEEPNNNKNEGAHRKPSYATPADRAVLMYDEPFNPDNFVHRVQGPSRCVAVFGIGSDEAMPSHTLKILSTFGAIQSSEFIRDRRTNKLKGFGFINFITVKDATKLVMEYSGKGLNVNGYRVRLDFSRTTGAAFQRDFVEGESIVAVPPVVPQRLGVPASTMQRGGDSGGRNRGHRGGKGRSRSPNIRGRHNNGGGKRRRSRSRDRPSFDASRQQHVAPQIVYVSATDGSIVPPPSQAPHHSQQQHPSQSTSQSLSQPGVLSSSSYYPAHHQQQQQQIPSQAPAPQAYMQQPAMYAAAPHPSAGGGYYYIAGPPPPGAQLVYDQSQPQHVPAHDPWYASGAQPRPASVAYEPQPTAAYYAAPAQAQSTASTTSQPVQQYDPGQASYYYPPQQGAR